MFIEVCDDVSALFLQNNTGPIPKRKLYQIFWSLGSEITEVKTLIAVVNKCEWSGFTSQLKWICLVFCSYDTPGVRIKLGTSNKLFPWNIHDHWTLFISFCFELQWACIFSKAQRKTTDNKLLRGFIHGREANWISRNRTIKHMDNIYSQWPHISNGQFMIPCGHCLLLLRILRHKV